MVTLKSNMYHGDIKLTFIIVTLNNMYHGNIKLTCIIVTLNNMYHGYIKLTCIMVMLNDSDCCPDMSLYCLSLNSIGYRRHDKVSVFALVWYRTQYV
jgi:uncharacterized membrane protein